MKTKMSFNPLLSPPSNIQAFQLCDLSYKCPLYIFGLFMIQAKFKNCQLTINQNSYVNGVVVSTLSCHTGEPRLRFPPRHGVDFIKKNLRPMPLRKINDI